MIWIIVGAVLFLLIGGAVASVFITYPIAKKLFNKQWVRSSDSKFERGCSDSSVDYHLDMFNKGMEFRNANLDKIKEVSISSMGLKLYGEYYDFGFKKAIILLPGRTETAYYGAFYAPTFIKGGYNVLCIDPRAHGLSEGYALTLGFEEAKDAINWAKFLHQEFGVKHVGLYGLCGGATCACLALTSKECPTYIDSFIADGMFYSFFRVYKRHIVDEKHPVYPVILEVMHLIKKINKVNPYKAKPYNLIKDIHVPTLILSGELDKFAIPKEGKLLFERCPAKTKQFHIIKNARHSHLRYDNTEAYENYVVSFLKSI